MRVIEVHNGVSGYWQLLAKVLEHGQPRAPRGLKTLDLGPVTIVMYDVTQSLPLGVGRNLSKKIAAVEALQLVGAFSSPELTIAASENFKRFVEPNGQFHGAYGRRIGNQLTQCVNKLRVDPDTRQAVISLWDPWLDNQPGKRDYPCTLTLAFALVNGALDLTVTMRSQDVFWGTPYDWWQFSQAQQTAARALEVDAGIYRHITLSTHIYEEFVDAARVVIDTTPPAPTDREWQPRGFGRDGDAMSTAIGRAHHIGATGLPPSEPITDSERWYLDVLGELR